MKNSFFFTLTFMFFLASCGGSAAPKANDTASIKKVEQLDSLSTEMENVAKEIENDTKALDDALSELDD